MRSIVAILPSVLATVIIAVRSPPAAGVNVALIAHVAKPPSMAGQLFVWLNSPAFVPPMTML